MASMGIYLHQKTFPTEVSTIFVLFVYANDFVMQIHEFYFSFLSPNFTLPGTFSRTFPCAILFDFEAVFLCISLANFQSISQARYQKLPKGIASRVLYLFTH